MARRVAVVAQNGVPLRLREREGFHGRRRPIFRRYSVRRNRASIGRYGWAARQHLGDYLTLDVVGRERFLVNVVFERERAVAKTVIDLEPVVAQQVPLVVQVLQSVGSRTGDRL